jgi:Ca2+-transporting ATPase
MDNERAAAAGKRGLSEHEAKQRLKKYGPNVFTQKKKVRPAAIFLAQFKDVLIIILIISTLLSVFMGEFTEAVAILLIIMLNAIMGFVQEYRTEKTLDALKSMAAPTARTIRAGVSQTVPAAQIVPGDIVLLEAGDRVPADAHLIGAAGIGADESLLTGESLPVNKRSGDSVYMGTMITKGHAEALVYATGMTTEMGRIAGMLGSIEDEQTPLQKRLEQLGKFIAIGCLIICAVVSVTGILRGEPVFNMIVTGISLAVAAVPEGLPAIVTISLALGVSRMLKRNALIRKLTSVETLGCASVICSDKTGTLTENRMTVREIYVMGRTVGVTGSGTKAEGDFTTGGVRTAPSALGDVRRVLEIGTCCNNASLKTDARSGLLRRGRPKITGITGDPTEAALLIAAEKAGITAHDMASRYRRISELPFDSDRKCMSVTVAGQNGERRLFVKGAPDVMLKKCAYVLSGGTKRPMTDAERREILAANDAMAGRALRVLAFACRDDPPRTQRPEELENSLTFAGLEGMMDPPRPEACEAVRKCRRAGIKVVMITGDHEKTAAAVAKELGILNSGDEVVTGAELERMSDAELMRRAPRISVYARVSPGHKLRIVRSYKRCGNVVAMTGDGVNDAPAVKEADIGVSMGRTGTDVTKEASSIVLLDDNFASMVSAVEEGRVIYSNIRKFIRYMLSCNIGEVLTMFLGMLFGMPVVLLPIQILWVNLVTDGLPAIALSLEPPDDDVMDKPPRGVDESIFSGGLAGTMILRGCIIGLSTLGVFISVLKFSGVLVEARTAAFLTLVLVQLIHVFECKSETKSLMHINVFSNIQLVFASLISLAMMLAVICLPSLRPIFATSALTFSEVLRVVGYSLIGPVIAALLPYRSAASKAAGSLGRKSSKHGAKRMPDVIYRGAATGGADETERVNIRRSERSPQTTRS